MRVAVRQVSAQGDERASDLLERVCAARAARPVENERRKLAAWDWVGLGWFAGPKKLEQVWLALARTHITVASRCREPNSPFAVHVSLRVPRGVRAVLGQLVKGTFDGVVCVFQGHTDRSTVPDLVTRLSKNVAAPEPEIERLLMNHEKAVLGSVPRLLHARGEGVIWAPADDLCVAGELLVEDTTDGGWAIRGRIIELHPCE
jgi:hypothetical protein